MTELKFAVPVITFALGVIFTVVFYRYQRRSELSRKASEDMVKLSAEWYTQLHEILVSAHDADKSKAQSLATAYSQNRLILPNYLKNIEILRRDKRAAELVGLGEVFLSQLTYHDTNHDKTYCLCFHAAISALPKAYIEVVNESIISASGYKSPFHDLPGGPPKLVELTPNYLNTLDRTVQKISKHAGKFAAH